MTEHVARPGRTAPVFVPVKVGDTFARDVGPDHSMVDYVVVESCMENAGQWYCVDCERAFRNNLDKDTHAEGGVHRLAWICFEHGPEVP